MASSNNRKLAQRFNRQANDNGKDSGRSPPIKVHFLGTITTGRSFPGETDSKRKERIKKEAEKNSRDFHKAIDILSQSPTGRYLLEEMTKAGYKLVFDERRTSSTGAEGLCDPADKLLILKPGGTADYIALLIAHEATHALQDAQRDMLPHSGLRPEAAIRLSFAIEADAYAHQVQVALELAHGEPSYPKPLEQMRKSFPSLVAAGEKALGQKDGLKNGAVIAAAFQGFYDSYYLRSFYETIHMNWAIQTAPELFKRSRKTKAFSKDVSPEWIKDRILHRGQPYLKKFSPNLNFSDPRYSGVTKKTEKTIQAFYQKWLGDQDPPAFARFGSYINNFSNNLSKTGSVAGTTSRRKKPRPPKP